MGSQFACAPVKHQIHRIDGLPLVTVVTQKQLSYMKKMEVFPDDIWVVTYPRSGTTWTQQILRNMLAKEDEDKPISLAMPWLEGANSNVRPYNVDMSVVKRPRTFKSHMPYNLCPAAYPRDLLENTYMWFRIRKT